MKPEEAIYLHHVLDAIAKVETYLTGVDESTFHDQTLIQDGVIRQLEIIGEAVKRLSLETRSLAPQIPWSAVAGMRDKLIHDYFGVDVDQVWLTASTDVSRLKDAVMRMLAILEAPS